MMTDLQHQYFNWMINILFHDVVLQDAYLELLHVLNDIPFEWSLEGDENRQKDAQDLRYLFGMAYGYEDAQICNELDIVPPSMLEVIVALINRVQDNILYDPEREDPNQEIFIDILKSLRIDDYKGMLSDEDRHDILDAVYRFFDRDYSYFGEGGLFVVNNPKADMRDTEIWFQFMWYLNEKQGGRYL